MYYHQMAPAPMYQNQYGYDQTIPTNYTTPRQYPQQYQQEPPMYRRADTDPKKLEQTEKDVQFSKTQNQRAYGDEFNLQPYQMRPVQQQNPNYYDNQQQQYYNDYYYRDPFYIQQPYYQDYNVYDYYEQEQKLKWHQKVWKFITCQQCNSDDQAELQYEQQFMYEVRDPNCVDCHPVYDNRPPQYRIQQFEQHQVQPRQQAHGNYFEQLRIEYHDGQQQSEYSNPTSMKTTSQPTEDHKIVDLKLQKSNQTDPNQKKMRKRSSTSPSVPVVKDNTGSHNQTGFGSYKMYESRGNNQSNNDIGKIKNMSFGESEC